MRFEEGQVIILNDDKEYVIWKIIDSYIYLMTIKKPTRIVITQYINDTFEVVKDKNNIKELLQK